MVCAVEGEVGGLNNVSVGRRYRARGGWASNGCSWTGDGGSLLFVRP